MKKFCAAACAAMLGASLAQAQPVPVPLESGILDTPAPAVSFLGNMTYDPSLSRLTVFLQNTSADDTDLSLTGFLFNSQGDALATYVDPDSSGGFQPITDGPGAGAGAFGQYEFGAALGGNFLSGGDPNNGFFPLESGNFFFNVTINGLAAADAVTVEDFLKLAGSDSTVQSPFVVRFRSAGDAGSVNTAGVKMQTPPPPVVPLPAAAWMALSGLALLPVVRRKLRQN